MQADNSYHDFAQSGRSTYSSGQFVHRRRILSSLIGGVFISYLDVLLGAPARAAVDKGEDSEFSKEIAAQLSEKSLLDYLVKPTIDVSNVSKPVVIPFDSDTQLGTTVTFSTATFARFRPAFGGVTYNSVDEHATSLSDTDTGLLTYEADDTAFDQLYVHIPDNDMRIHKLCFNMAAALKVSAYTSGNFSLTSLRAHIYKLGDNFRAITLFDKTWTSGLGNLTATGEQIFIVDDDVVVDIPVEAGQQVVCRLITAAAAGVGTRQEGLLDWFSYKGTAAPKSLMRNELVIHGYAQISNADRALREQQNRVDYSGVKQVA